MKADAKRKIEQLSKQILMIAKEENVTLLITAHGKAIDPFGNIGDLDEINFGEYFDLKEVS